MIKTLLLVLLGLFFILNGLNHLFNNQVLVEYAHKRGLFSPKFSVFMSGLLLIFGGLTLITGFLSLSGSWVYRFFWFWPLSPFTSSGMRKITI